MLHGNLCSRDISVVAFNLLMIFTLKVILDALVIIPFRIGDVFAWIFLAAKQLL